MYLSQIAFCNNTVSKHKLKCVFKSLILVEKLFINNDLSLLIILENRRYIRNRSELQMGYKNQGNSYIL